MKLSARAPCHAVMPEPDALGTLVVRCSTPALDRVSRQVVRALVLASPVLGLRLQYGEKDRRPSFWPTNVPWKKGKPLSMMNHGELSSVFCAMWVMMCSCHLEPSFVLGP